jgi:glycosyltransferase involved in cell wall biosynthesis
MSLARSVMSENVRHEMLSYPGKTGLLEYYRTQPIDLFVNTSESEGTPVTIMEAISVGIPVMATAVGGNTEIVTEENGVAISADPDPAEIADAIRCLMVDDTRLARLREGSKDKWQREYSAAQNYANFAAAIREL